ncbi:MAG: S-layer homology domain-containing protein, partial [Peptococcaceae bacterium]|nr:S-layer homology domain-containing protein [Peptococcaceae bacterium]
MGHHLRRFISWTLLLALPLSTAAAPAFAEESAPTEYAAATDACTPEIAANGSGENAAVVGENTEPPLEEDPAGEQTPPEQEPITEPEQPVEDPGESSEPPATDPSVIATTWTSAHVRYLGGYEDRSVRPERQVTRAEAAAIVYRLLEDSEAGTGSCSYGDVNDSDWFAINV